MFCGVFGILADFFGSNFHFGLRLCAEHQPQRSASKENLRIASASMLALRCDWSFRPVHYPHLRT